MKLKSIISATVLISAITTSWGQSIKGVFTQAENPEVEVKTVNDEKLSGENYKLMIFLVGNVEEINSMKSYDISEVLYINGTKIENSYSFYYEKSADADETEKLFARPSMYTDVYLGNMIEDNGNLAKASGNTLKIEFVNKQKDMSVITSAEVKFDVSGYNDFKSDFCDLLAYKSDDPKVDQTIKSMFDMMYPKAEFISVLMSGTWSEYTNSAGEINSKGNTYMLVFKYKGKLWTLKYSVEYAAENGVLLPMARVKCYNGFVDPRPISESCWKDLQSKIK